MADKNLSVGRRVLHYCQQQTLFRRLPYQLVKLAAVAVAVAAVVVAAVVAAVVFVDVAATVAVFVVAVAVVVEQTFERWK